MEKKKYGIVGGGILVLALVAVIGITYAAFSQTLNINGTASVSVSSWKIKFANLSEVQKTGTATEITAPTINTNDTTIGDFAVKLDTPGDSISYTFDVKNEGTFNAEVSSITIPTPTCTGMGEQAAVDAENVCKNLSYTLTYADGTAIQTGDKLNASESKSMKLTLTYKGDINTNELPNNDVAISDLATSIIYGQAS